MTRILLIDDRKEERDLLKTLLRSTASEYLEATTLQDAVRGIRELQPDLVILDLQLGNNKRAGLDILEATADIAERPPVIVVTAYGSFDAEVSAIRAGAWRYLERSTDTEYISKLRAQAKLALAVFSRRNRDE